MELSEALLQLKAWCDQSAGQPIVMLPERTAVFESRSAHGEEAIREVEKRLACSLPDSYRRFMATIGASSLFSWSPHGGGPRFYRPDEIREASLGAAVKRADGGEDRFCFVGEHRLMGDFMGFLISRLGPKNFDVFCHEYPLDEYVAVSDEIKSWRTFEAWLIHQCKPEVMTRSESRSQGEFPCQHDNIHLFSSA
jgi:hypothetical protein